MALVGSIALAVALAFGLGGREVASRMLEDWYSRRGELADNAGRMARAARTEARNEAREMESGSRASLDQGGMRRTA